MEELMSKQKIFVTKDYNLFKKYDKNREVNENHIRYKLIPSMEKYGWLLTSPMIVDKDFYIKDGQHRFMAAKELNIKIPYIVTDNYTDDVIFDINNNSKPWTVFDKVKYMAKIGNLACKKVVYLIEKYKMPIGVLTRLTNQWQNYTKTYEFRDFNLDKAEECCIKILQVCNIVKKKDSKIMYALIHMMKNEKYNHEKMCKSLSKRLDKFNVCNTRDAYIKMLQGIYNYNVQKDLRVLFFQEKY